MKISKFDFLEEINEVLENSIEYIGEDRSHPNYFIIGAPRSGTTVLMQLLSSLTNVGFIDNLAASFWQAPEIGALLSKKLIKDRTFSGESEFGQTGNISEPHEFGAFWRKYLNYPDTSQIESHSISWAPLLEKLDNISSIFESPTLYKVFQLMWHAADFHSLKTDSKWIWITRNETQNIHSLMKYRDHLNVDDHTWVSVKPIKSGQYDDAAPLLKCASQVLFINEWIEGQLRLIPDSNWTHIELETLIDDPEKAIRTVSQFLDLKIDPTKLGQVQNKLHAPEGSANSKILRAIEVIRSTSS